MLKLSFWRLMAALLLVSLVSACGGGAGGSAPPPGGFTVTPGNGQATITWTASPGVQYWLMYAPTATPIDISNPPSNHAWATSISSPYVITGLTNGVTYSFAMNARTDGGKGGAQTASQSVTPHYAGTAWLAGTGTGTSNLRGVAYGTSTADSLNYFLAVGDSGAVYKVLDGVSQSISGYAWTSVSTAPSLAYKAAINALSKYIAVGANGAIVSSADLVAWTATSSPVVTTSLNALASNGAAVVAVGDGGTLIYSTDGSTWKSGIVTSGSSSANLYGVAYSPYTTSWVAVGAGGALLTSADAMNWSVGNSGVTKNLYGVAASAGNVLVAVGDSGTLVTSSAGGAWTSKTLGTASGTLFAVSTDSAQFLVTGAGGILFSSLDGTTWSAITRTATNRDLLAIVGSASKYMVVGIAGANVSSIN
jgi:hypothetical protein